MAKKGEERQRWQGEEAVPRIVPRVPGESAQVEAVTVDDAEADAPAEAPVVTASARRQPLQIDTSEPVRPLPGPVVPMDYDAAMAGLLDGSLKVPLYTTRGYLVDQPLIEKAA